MTGTGNYTIQISAPELFGGEDSEGGIVGPLEVMFGAPDQVPSGVVQNLIGGLVPGFRGTVTAFFNGLICVNNPYPKSWKFRVRRWSEGWDGDCWYPETCLIPLGDGSHGSGGITAMNAAHMIYQCATDRSWGRGLDRARIDDASFRASALTLFNESFGLCMRWNRSDTLAQFVQSVISHVGGSLYTSRETGLLTFDLIRGDYDPELVPVYEYGSGLLSIDTVDSLAQGDTQINEIIVKYHDPRDNTDGSVRAHNLALLQATGAVFSDTVEYPGIPTPDLALRVAYRDLKPYATGLRKFKVTLDRRAWRIAPGKVFAVRAPSRGIEKMILRAGRFQDGKLEAGAITIEAAQDVWGLPASPVAAPQQSGWVPPNREALPLTNRRVVETTYRDLVLKMSSADLAALEATSTTISALAGRPTPLALAASVASRPVGSPYIESNLTPFVPVATLRAQIGAYVTGTFIDPISDTGDIRRGRAALIEEEIVRVDYYEPTTGEITFARGCVDTLPAVHPENAVVWFYDPGSASDGKEYLQGETVDVKLLTRTSSRQLALADAPVNSILLAGRQGRPYPPAGLKINGTNFNGYTAAPAGDIVFTWHHRNRLLQADTLVAHNEAAVTPEAGTTYVIRVYNGAALVRTTDAGLVNTWTYTAAMAVADGNLSPVTFEIESRRDGLASLQHYRITLQRS